jgi:outer membrane protein
MPSRRMLKLLGAAALLVLPLSGAAAESLTDALALAYASNPTIRAERARLRATEELKAQAWSGALPQISAQGGYSNVKDTQTINPAIFGTGGTRTSTFQPLTGSVSGELPVFTGFRNYNAIRQARARVRAGGAQLAAVEQDVLSRVATAYFDVLRDLAIYDSNANNVEVLVRQKQEADLRFKVGEVTKTDVSQAEARLAGARAGLAGAQAQLAFSRATYAELVGQAPGTLEPVLALPDLPESLDSAKELADAYAPGVVAAREQEEASRRQVAIAKGALLPSVSIVAGYDYADEPSTFIQKDETFSYGVRASAPLFAGGSNWSQIREARALHDSARASVIEAERRAASAVTAVWEQIVAARITISAARAQVAANELALDGVRREAQVGTRSTLDVLDAEQEYLNAKVTLANAERDERVAAFSLLAAAGVLNPEAIGINGADLIPAQD